MYKILHLVVGKIEENVRVAYGDYDQNTVRLLHVPGGTLYSRKSRSYFNALLCYLT